MYYIGICDDVMDIRTQLEEMVKTYGQLNEEPITLLHFESGEDVLEYLMDRKHLDLLLLDIEMYELSGVELGVKIRNEFKLEDLQIVYISGLESYAMELFQVRPLHFLIKPISESKIHEVLKKAFDLNQKDHYYNVKIGQTIRKIKAKDILYFEGEGRRINLYTKDEVISFYEKIDQVYEVVKDFHFLAIHKSILVNYHRIIEFSYEYVVMTNQKTLPISQSKRKEVRRLQCQYEKEGVL